jgi:hypothetical protein
MQLNFVRGELYIRQDAHDRAASFEFENLTVGACEKTRRVSPIHINELPLRWMKQSDF